MKYNDIKSLTIYSIILVIGMVSCSKEEDEESNSIVQVSECQEGLDYYPLINGSHWVYNEIRTSSSDSQLFVTGAAFYFEIDIDSSVYGIDYKFRKSAIGAVNDYPEILKQNASVYEKSFIRSTSNYKIGELRYFQEDVTISPDEVKIIDFCLDVGERSETLASFNAAPEIVGNYKIICEYEEELNELVLVDGSTFNDVRKFRVQYFRLTTLETEFHFEEIYWLANGIGPVKYDDSRLSYSLELLNYEKP